MYRESCLKNRSVSFHSMNQVHELIKNGRCRILWSRVVWQTNNNFRGCPVRYFHLIMPIRKTVKLDNLQGLGLFAARDLEKHTMVIEYIGQLIRNEVAELREKIYEKQVSRVGIIVVSLQVHSHNV